TAGTSDVVETVINVPFQMFFQQQLGVYAEGLPKYLSWIEFIPVVDTLPLYTFSALFALKAYKKDFKAKNGSAKDKEKAQRRFDKLKISLSTGQTTFLKKASFILVAVLIAVLALFVFTDVGARTLKSVTNMDVEIDLSPQNIMGNIRYKSLQATNYIKGRWDRSIKIATGEYDSFEGTVEGLDQNVGLELELDKGIDSFYITSNSASPVLFSTLSGRGLDPKICNLIGGECDLKGEIKLSCSSADPDIGTKISPETLTFTGIEDSYYEATCELDISKMKKNKESEIVYFSTDFEFMTMGYKRANFVDSVRNRELESEENFRFPSSDARYTPGPVRISFNEIKNPLLVGDNRRMQFKFSIQNVGEGKIKRFEKIAFKVPQGIKFEQCNYFFKEGGNEFVMDELLFESRDFLLIEKTKTIDVACSLELSKDVLDLNNIYTTDSFQVLVAYEYSLRDDMKINFEYPLKVDDLNDCNTFCVSEGGCRCLAANCKLPDIIPKYHNCGGDDYNQWKSECTKLSEEDCANKELNNKKICVFTTKDGCQAKTKASS
ncbi:hypothetical protein KY321_00345, partial [Candidatus Woesearchaeota archaeon]|nr:hypothetical protein [Candidatus Woesearchaeota archaeon]